MYMFIDVAVEIYFFISLLHSEIYFFIYQKLGTNVFTYNDKVNPKLQFFYVCLFPLFPTVFCFDLFLAVEVYS